MKVCRECGTEKPLSEYHRAKGCRDGHAGTCKVCHYEKCKAYRKTEAGRAARGRERKAYMATPRGRAVQRAGVRRYQRTEKGQEAVRRARERWAKSESKRLAGRKTYNKQQIRALTHAAERLGLLPAKSSLGCALSGVGVECDGPLQWDHCGGHESVEDALNVKCVCRRHNIVLERWRKYVPYLIAQDRSRSCLSFS